MSSSSEGVKRWRHRNKERIVEAMGGKCVVCGYSKCLRALDLHHLNPAEKEFSFGKATANPRAWAQTVIELRKCVLICGNCHAEVHAGLTEVPGDAPKFNEKFADQAYVQSLHDELSRRIHTKECAVCGKLIPETQRTCSRSCAAKLRGYIDWSLVDLRTELSTKTVDEIAKELKCSVANLNRHIDKLNIPKKRKGIQWDSINLQDEIRTRSFAEIATSLGCTRGTVERRVRQFGYVSMMGN